jgi:hypothetical protein
MRRPTRPAHHVPTPLEMAVHDDGLPSQRIGFKAYIWFLVIALAPAAIPLGLQVLSWWGRL